MTRSLMLVLLLSAVVFAEEAPAPDAGPAVYEAVLCTSWSETLEPEGAAEEFFADAATVRIVFSADRPAPAGTRFTPVVVDAAGFAVLRGQPIRANGGSNRFGSGFLLAGQDWSRAGGSFRFRVLRNDESAPVVDKPFTVRTAKRWALLVGIADYPPLGPGGADLPAPDQDALRMRDLLVGSFGVPVEQIVVVTNLEATSGRIAAELARLAEVAGPDDAVLFYYTGHGTQIPDLDGDEEDGWDEALATADEKPPLVTTADELSLYLSDDRLAELLAAFETENVTVIFDSCHSGTAVREGEGAPGGEGFFAPMRSREGFSRRLVEAAEDAKRGDRRGDAGLDLDRRYVFLSSARSWETAMGGADGGLFSMLLRDALRTSNGESWTALVNRIRPVLEQWNPGQSPELLGAAARYPFSTAETPADAPYVRPTVAVVGAFDPEAPSLLLEGRAGTHRAYVSGLLSLMNEQAGTVYDAYPAADREFAGPPTGRVVLTGRPAEIPRLGAAGLLYAEAEIVAGEVRRGDRLVPRTVRSPAERPAVGVFFGAGGAGDERLAASAAALVKLLGANQTVEMRQGTPAEMDYVVVPRRENDVTVAEVYTPALTWVGRFAGPDEEIAKQLGALVAGRHREFGRVVRIANPSPAFALDAAVDGGESPRRAGTPATIRATAGVPARFFAVAAVAGGPAQIVAKTAEPLPAGEPFTFTLPIPAGAKDRVAVKVFAVTKPIDLAAVERAPPKAVADALLAALRRIAPPPGGEAGLLGTDDWAAVALRIPLVE